jgi:hypothetical protein
MVVGGRYLDRLFLADFGDECTLRNAGCCWLRRVVVTWLAVFPITTVLYSPEVLLKLGTSASGNSLIPR